MRIAVTGGAGFLGRYVVDALRIRGDEPVVVDRSQGIDVLGPALADALAGCDGVIHLAGVLGTAELFKDAERAIDTNVKGTLRVLQCCARYGLRYVGITMPHVWANVYQATKMAAEELAHAWHQHQGVPVSHVRAFNAYGPGQHVGSPQKIVPTFAARAWAGEPIPIWGDGEQEVDLVWAGDIARMLVDALAFGACEVFDAGTGVSMTVNAVADLVLDVTGSRAGVEHLPMRPGEHTGVQIAARGDGWDLLGWHPVPRPFALVDTICWYRPVAEEKTA